MSIIKSEKDKVRKILVSVIIPCFRDSKTLKGAIDSVLAQTYKDIEIIVVNDSSPETEEIERVLKDYPSILYLRNDINLGLAATRNVGIKYSSGDFIAFLDSDDEYHPKKIEFQMGYVGENIAVACNVDIFHGHKPSLLSIDRLNSGQIKLVNGLWKISIFNYLTGASILVRRNILLSVGGYDESLRSCEDYDLWLRLIKKGVQVIHILLPLYLYRFNPEGLSKNVNAISHWELEVVKKNVLTLGKAWPENFLIFLIWISWFIRHLLRAEIINNSQLTNATMSNAKNYQPSLIVYYVISGINFFRMPSIFLTVKNLINRTYLKRLFWDFFGRPKERNFNSCESKNIPVPSNKLIWISFFIYSLVIALLFQMLLPKILPALYAGNGLLSQDALYFHQSAITLAEEIRRNGWGAWKMWPNSYTTGNVAILGAIYALYGYKPVLLLPINAVLHASSGLCLVLIGRQLFSGHSARVGSLIAGCLYVTFPSSFNWYAQNHKDDYAALGFYLLVLAGIRLLIAKTYKESYSPFLLALGGLGLTIFVRPNNLQLYALLAIGIVLIGYISAIKNKTKFISILIYASAIFLITVLFRVSPHQESSAPQRITSDFAQTWEWKATPELPGAIDNTFKKIANIRVFMAANALRDGAGSMIDIDRMPANFNAVMRYFPVAGMNGLFAPYPNTWVKKSNLFWLVGVIEIAAFYLLFPGMLWLLWKSRKNLALWWVILSAYGVLTVEAFLISNLGTLHRIRYPFIFIFILLSCIGWCNFLKLYFPKNFVKDKLTLLEIKSLPLLRVRNLNIVAIQKAFPLILVSGLLFFSLFIRDVLLAKVFGLGLVLDNYQFSANIPLASVALLAVPLSPALIAHFIRLRSSSPFQARQWVQAMSGKLLLWFSVLAILLLLIQTSGLMRDDLKHDLFLGALFFPVVFFSGITVLGNSVLICNNQAIRATCLQLLVPMFTIYLVYFYGEPQLGVIAPIAGLVFGQIINLAFVAYFCGKCGFPLFPRISSIDWGEWGPTYLSLVASTAISSLSVPVALYFSASLPVGSTSTFYLGAKIYQAINLFISIVFLSLVLPYFTKLVADGSRGGANKIFQSALISGLYITALASPLLCLIVPELVKFILLSDKIGVEELDNLILVSQIGMMQLPFFVASLTIIKYLVALKETGIIFYATLLGLFFNIYLSYQGSNIEILAIGVALGFVSTTLALIFWAKTREMLGWTEVYFIFLILLVSGATALSVLLSNYLALVFSAIIYINLPFFFSSIKSREKVNLT